MNKVLNKVIQALMIWGIYIHGYSQNDFGEAKQKSDFARLAAYMSRSGGTWITENPAYDSTDTRSVREIQMRLTYDGERQVLRDEVTLKFAAFDYLSWISFWAYHSGKKAIIYDSYGPEGRIISGITVFANDSTFITTDTLYEPDGTAKELKDENRMVSDSVHRNISYEMKNGRWEPAGSYEWHLKTPEMKKGE